MIEVVRKPKTLLERPPFGPFRVDDKPGSTRGFDLEVMPVPVEMISRAATRMYEELETELADKYAIDLAEGKDSTGEPKRNPYVGRATNLGTRMVPIYQPTHGVAGGNHVSGF